MHEAMALFNITTSFSINSPNNVEINYSVHCAKYNLLWFRPQNASWHHRQCISSSKSVITSSSVLQHLQIQSTTTMRADKYFTQSTARNFASMTVPWSQKQLKNCPHLQNDHTANMRVQNPKYHLLYTYCSYAPLLFLSSMFHCPWHKWQCETHAHHNHNLSVKWALNSGCNYCTATFWPQTLLYSYLWTTAVNFDVRFRGKCTATYGCAVLVHMPHLWSLLANFICLRTWQCLPGWSTAIETGHNQGEQRLPLHVHHMAPSRALGGQVVLNRNAYRTMCREHRWGSSGLSFLDR